MPFIASLLCTVIAISDGDTLTARCTTETLKIRLAEIDAPEKAQPFGNRSKQSLAELCFQKEAEVVPQTLDRYGRTVARVTCKGIDANREQVKRGMAWAFTKYLTDKTIKDEELAARAAQVGLWADSSPPVAPWDWRKQAKEVQQQ